MRTNLAATLFIFLAFASCSLPETESAKKRHTPKALEDKVSSVEMLSKRASYDLLDALYTELTDQTPELKALEERFDKLKTGKPDSFAAFTNFNNKNEAYYALTNKYVLQVQDTLLQKELQQLLKESLDKYHDSTSVHREILRLIGTKQRSLDDLHTALKIVCTLPLIERYQKEHLPSPAPLQNFSGELDSVRMLMDSLPVMRPLIDSIK